VLVKERAARDASQAAAPPARIHPALIARSLHRSLVARAN
jgi:hypothetical protein